MEKEENTQHEYESNILHKCKKCERLITTESIIDNYNKLDENTFKHYKMKKEEFIFFIWNEADADKISWENLEYTISEKNRKIFCKKCESVIGYYKLDTNNKKILGILQTDKIQSKQINMIKSEPKKERQKPDIQFINKLVIDNKINIQLVKNTNKILTSFTKDFYRMEIVECGKKLSITQAKIDHIYNLLGINEEKQNTIDP